MANRITFDRRVDLPDLGMSNGASIVFWDVLRLAAEAFEHYPAEDEPLGYLLALTPTESWYGCSGFDLDEMPWRADRLEQDRSVVLRAIDLAVAGAGWERLDYIPDPDLSRQSLTKFRALVSAYQPPALGGARVYATEDRNRQMAFVFTNQPRRLRIIQRYLCNAGAFGVVGNACHFPEHHVVTPELAGDLFGELEDGEHITFVTAVEGRLNAFTVGPAHDR